MTLFISMALKPFVLLAGLSALEAFRQWFPEGRIKRFLLMEL